MAEVFVCEKRVSPNRVEGRVRARETHGEAGHSWAFSYSHNTEAENARNEGALKRALSQQVDMVYPGLLPPDFEWKTTVPLTEGS